MGLATPASLLSGFGLVGPPRLLILHDSVVLPNKATSLGSPPLGDWLHQGPWVETSLNWLVRGKFSRRVGGPPALAHLDPYSTTRKYPRDRPPPCGC